MKMHLVIAVAAASILLTSAAFAASTNPNSDHGRCADRYTVVTDNEELMCKVAGTQSQPADWAHAIAHLQAEGATRCTPSMMNGI
jgi:hypothetical protein